MAKVEIRIETPADTQGAKQASAAIEQTAAAAAKASQATGQLNTASQANTATQEKQTSSLRRLAEGFKKVGQQVPLVEAALNAIKNPWTAVAAVIAIAASKVLEFGRVVGEMMATIDKLSPANNTIKTFFELIARNKQSDADFAKRLAAIGAAAETGEARLARLNSALERTLGLEAEEDAAAKNVEIAKVEQQVKTGKLSAAQGLAQRNIIDARFDARAKDRESRRAAGQVTNLFNARTAAEDARIAAERQLPGARDERQAAGEKLATEELRLKNLSEVGIVFGNRAFSRDEANKERLKLEGDVASAQELYGRLPAPSVKAQLEKAQAGLLGITEAIAGYDRNLDQQRSLVVSARGRAEGASRNVSDLEGRIASNAEARARFQSAFTEAVAGTNQTRTSRDRTAALEQTATGIEEQTALLVETMRRIEEALKLVNAANKREFQR